MFTLPHMIEQRMERAVRELNKLREEVEAKYPNHQVGYYLDGTGNLNLMIEPKGQMAMDQKYIAYTAKLKRASGGDW